MCDREESEPILRFARCTRVCVAFLIGRELVKESEGATAGRAMGEEVEKHILRKYELLQKLGKGVSALLFECVCVSQWVTLMSSDDF